MAITNPYQPNYTGYAPYALPAATSFTPARPNTQGITWVNGEEAARTYPIPYNSTAMLMDSENPVLYVKTIDSMGRIVDFEVYDLINRSPKKETIANFKPDDFVKKNDLEKMMSDINKRFDELAARRNPQTRKEDRT